MNPAGENTMQGRRLFINFIVGRETYGLQKAGDSIKYNLEIVPSKDMPELSIIDYLMWAVQRSLLQGESRYLMH